MFSSIPAADDDDDDDDGKYAQFRTSDAMKIAFMYCT